MAAPGTRRISILGATGSIGASTVDLLLRNPQRYRIEAVTAGRNVSELARVARLLGARFAAISDPTMSFALKDELSGPGIAAAAGEDSLVEAAERPADWVMAAISGASGLRATLAAAERGAAIALANKECLVCAGAYFMRRAKAAGAEILPVDSEHNALFQVLSAGRREDVRKLVLTASGGPFRTWSAAAIAAAAPEQALRHPNWTMGAKVTIDSASLMNKGLELIEAHHLFKFEASQIDVLVHPQSIVHGLVEFKDGSLIAQLGAPDMRIPIAHCLAWPERIADAAPRLDLTSIAGLSFEKPDLLRFPALRLARESLAAGGPAPTILNAANEVAVGEFLARRLSFGGIPRLVEATLAAVDLQGLKEPDSVEEAVAIDHVSRSVASGLLPQIAAIAS
jgi:1-deoxy-D-xylulose-5-phosphate reductoisomerase